MPGRPYIQAPFPVPQRLEALVMDGFILSSSNQCSNPAGLERKQWDRSVHESIKETRVPDRSQVNQSMAGLFHKGQSVAISSHGLAISSAEPILDPWGLNVHQCWSLNLQH